ncbi:MAG TPA: acyl-CoA reductase [Cyclobacteriaceae bacterium]|nr:acyl-CoA reductase [Cyclobacteriaceae bacterium]
MKLSERIAAFTELGKRLHSIEVGDKNDLYRQAGNYNAWFTPQQCELALKGISKFLVNDKLEQWVMPYNLSPSTPRKVGVVMAGNIPMVGFHDMLSVLISGHHLAARLSSQDTVLMRYAAEQLVDIQPGFKPYISFVERLNDAEMVIATGSDNTARYFEYYFRNIPHIIRKNRSSCAILRGDETPEQLITLGKDVFSYYGLGCRNVSKLFVPEGYNFSQLLGLWDVHKDVFNHHKYANNYEYNKSILLVNGTPFLDNGFVLITENSGLVSPISVLYYETGTPDLSSDKIQCIATSTGWLKGSVPFGKTQEPELWDYADGVNTIEFLSKQ